MSKPLGGPFEVLWYHVTIISKAHLYLLSLNQTFLFLSECYMYMHCVMSYHEYCNIHLSSCDYSLKN